VPPSVAKPVRQARDHAADHLGPILGAHALGGLDLFQRRAAHILRRRHLEVMLPRTPGDSGITDRRVGYQGSSALPCDSSGAQKRKARS
jgi:hypothetical protein